MIAPAFPLLLVERFDVGSVPAARNQSLDRLAAAFFRDVGAKVESDIR